MLMTASSSTWIFLWASAACRCLPVGLSYLRFLLVSGIMNIDIMKKNVSAPRSSWAVVFFFVLLGMFLEMLWKKKKSRMEIPSFSSPENVAKKPPKRHVVIFSHVLSLILLCLIKPLCFSRCQNRDCHMTIETVTWPSGPGWCYYPRNGLKILSLFRKWQRQMWLF